VCAGRGNHDKPTPESVPAVNAPTGAPHSNLSWQRYILAVLWQRYILGYYRYFGRGTFGGLPVHGQRYFRGTTGTLAEVLSGDYRYMDRGHFRGTSGTLAEVLSGSTGTLRRGTFGTLPALSRGTFRRYFRDLPHCLHSVRRSRESRHAHPRVRAGRQRTHRCAPFEPIFWQRYILAVLLPVLWQRYFDYRYFDAVLSFRLQREKRDEPKVFPFNILAS
jgi:hypothetical protein